MGHMLKYQYEGLLVNVDLPLADYSIALNSVVIGKA